MIAAASWPLASQSGNKLIAALRRTEVIGLSIHYPFDRCGRRDVCSTGWVFLEFAAYRNSGPGGLLSLLRRRRAHEHRKRTANNCEYCPDHGQEEYRRQQVKDQAKHRALRLFYYR